MDKAVVFWSGGKDSALALYKARHNAGMEVVGLVTTLNNKAGSTAVHQISEEVLERQVQETGLSLLKMWVSAMPYNSEYEQALLKVYSQLKTEGISTVIYGDIFLEDIKAYRENLLKKVGLKSCFPLWQLDPAKLMDEFIQSGFKAITCCINTGLLNENWLGRELNQQFFDDLPFSVDPAGENGEYHTFCYGGPVFKNTVKFKTGAKHFSSLPISRKQRNNQEFGYIDIV